MARLSHFGTEVRKFSRADIEGMVVVDSSVDHFLRSGGNPDDLPIKNSCLIKSSGSTCSALVKIHTPRRDNNSEKVFVKKFFFKGIVHSLKPVFRLHRAQIMWKVSWHLLEHSIPVPEPEGYLLKRRGPFCLQGYFFSRVVPRCSTLDELTEDLEQLTKRLDSGGLIEVLARNVARMHDSRVSHGDLKWPNILVEKENNELWFVDLDAAKLHRHRVSVTAVARDLARFVLYGFQTQTDNGILNRFLDEYCLHRKLVRESIEARMAKVIKKLSKRHRSIPEERIREVLKSY